MPKPIVVQGIGANGWDGLSEPARRRVLEAEVLLGGERHLELVPPVDGQEREAWPSPLREGLLALLWRYDGRQIVALASGDPLRSGVATTLIAVLGADAVQVEPVVSSVALARARMGWSAEESAVVRVQSDAAVVLRELAPGRRVLVLSADHTTPAAVAALLTRAGYGATTMTVLADLGATTERTSTSSAGAWTGAAPELHVLALELAGPAADPVSSWAGGLPDSAYDHDGQLTKRDVRASALARLRPQPGQLLWDVGAGAGSVGIEWLRAHPTCRAVAVEADPDRAERIVANARTLGVPDLVVLHGRAPEALADLSAPDAVFVGGGATAEGLLEACRDRLRPGGRLVVHGVTLETEQVLAAAYAEHGGELTRIAVETAAPIGSFTGWSPARAVTQWSWEKP